MAEHFKPAFYAFAVVIFCGGPLAGATNLRDLEPNTWTLIHREDKSGGKMFARAIFAENVNRLYLWGTGGEKPARNVYLRYELESFDLAAPDWTEAFPRSMRDQWRSGQFPPFRILGQSGPDGLKHNEGPRLQTVGGFHKTNRVRWWDFDGIQRPSPIHTFNMACWDSKRNRIIYYGDGCTFALDPTSNTWSDLKPANHPTTCRTVAWASMCYDPHRDRALLFGGGLATNPTGGAPTWMYDCRDNQWTRPERDKEPPLRCNASIVYDPDRQVMIMFGGYNQAAALNDTWIFDGRTDRWEQRIPEIAPPPMFAPAAAIIPGTGKVLVCGYDARKVTWTHKVSTSAIKETWVYDLNGNTWTPVHGDLKLSGYRWLTATGSPELGVVMMVAFGHERRTYAFRYDPDAKPAECPGAQPGAIAWKYPEQKQSLEDAPAPDPGKHKAFLASLPMNTFVDAQPPGLLISKTWSTAVIDTDRSEIIYVGGGHSGYSGNDIARYSIALNRWLLDFPPRFPPFLESTNAGLFGWSYGMMPFSQHTYLWYAYDPASKTIVYLARPSISDGTEVQLDGDPDGVFIYDSKTQGYASWIYNPSVKRMHTPSFGRPFDNPWHLSLVGTADGVYATCYNRLYHGDVNRANGHVQWALVDPDSPKPRKSIKYHYEFQPVVHDTRRNRLVQLKGDDHRVDLYARSLTDQGAWQQLETTGKAAIGREAVYIPRYDTILWLGTRLFAFDCKTGKMAKLDVELPKGLYTHECAMEYDPKHDVCVALIPQKFSGPMQTFLFRFDPKTVAYR